jgi:dienelactone hydrolase
MLKTLVLILCLAASGNAQQSPPLPRPTGQFAIGRTWLAAGKEMCLLFYPARQSETPAPYIEEPVVKEIAQTGYYDQSAETIEGWAHIKTQASENAMALSGPFPLIVFLPGAGVFAFHFTTLAEELASHGYVVAVADYFALKAPERSYKQDDYAAMENDMARVAIAGIDALKGDPAWKNRIRFDRIGAMGHSIGGAAAIGLARMDKNIRASVDMDGAPFGESLKGAVVPALILRSKPIYSDEDLKKRGRTREQMDKAGEEARKTWMDFEEKSGKTPVEILSVKGTGHFSFTDAPFVMPDTITRFGGKIIAPEHGEQVVSSCLLGFFDAHLREKSKSDGLEQCRKFEEIVPATGAQK